MRKVLCTSFSYAYFLTNVTESVEACSGVGRSIALTHDADVIHGDLTTSNFMLRNSCSNNVVCLAGMKIYNRTKFTMKQVMIDFGLSYTSSLAEDKAVDLYVLERAFLSTHPNSEALVSCILATIGYLISPSL